MAHLVRILRSARLPIKIQALETGARRAAIRLKNREDAKAYAEKKKVR